MDCFATINLSGMSTELTPLPALSEAFTVTFGESFEFDIKLNADVIVPNISDVFIWQDADVIWCRQQNWHNAEADAIIGKVQEYHSPYIKSFLKITGAYPGLGFSTIRHHEYVKKNVLFEIRKSLSDYHNLTFTRSIVDNLDYSENSNFSEYDLYANWCFMSNKKTYVLDLVWENINFIPNSLPENFDFLAPQKWMRKND